MTDYIRCFICGWKMYGIRDRKARTACDCCGGRPLISDDGAYQLRLYQAKMAQAWEDNPKSYLPTPDAPEAA